MEDLATFSSPQSHDAAEVAGGFALLQRMIQHAEGVAHNESRLDTSVHEAWPKSIGAIHGDSSDTHQPLLRAPADGEVKMTSVSLPEGDVLISAQTAAPGASPDINSAGDGRTCSMEIASMWDNNIRQVRGVGHYGARQQFKPATSQICEIKALAASTNEGDALCESCLHSVLQDMLSEQADSEPGVWAEIMYDTKGKRRPNPTIVLNVYLNTGLQLQEPVAKWNIGVQYDSEHLQYVSVNAGSSMWELRTTDDQGARIGLTRPALVQIAYCAHNSAISQVCI
ncbi:hypothetical protein CYMTET_39031 [Cymbomonas tetramitiformis]|uniref:Uncharacterized protein n=1 Tax=Cymbomonas tetramitiformis TaxID=36881 RepID=A0AAE0CC79_9CHLO|nr:hypothetical protein CYMTET_39031 [Cymbomonas tetramitiformis]